MTGGGDFSRLVVASYSKSGDRYEFPERMIHSIANHCTLLKHNACGKILFESGTVPPLLESFTCKNPEITGIPSQNQKARATGPDP